MDTKLKGTGAHRVLAWLLKEGWIIIDPDTAMGMDTDIVLRSLEAHFPELSTPDREVVPVECPKCGIGAIMYADELFPPDGWIEIDEGNPRCEMPDNETNVWIAPRGFHERYRKRKAWYSDGSQGMRIGFYDLAGRYYTPDEASYWHPDIPDPPPPIENDDA